MVPVTELLRLLDHLAIGIRVLTVLFPVEDHSHDSTDTCFSLPSSLKPEGFLYAVVSLLFKLGPTQARALVGLGSLRYVPNCQYQY